jgi:hypothetical protein
VRARDRIGVRRRPGSESGQATTEFALILFPLLLLVAGIIQFGIALNYWLDLQRIANQGARWAVVNNYPGCPRTGPSAPCSPTLQEYIACQPVPGPLNPSVTISFPSGGTPKSGDPVEVKVGTTFDFVPILGIGNIGLTGDATMRLEQTPTRFITADNLTVGQATCP